MNSKTNITTFQLGFLLIHAQIGVGILSMPHDIFKMAEEDSWITILLTGMFIQIFILLYGALQNRFPNKNLFEIARTLLGKKIGNIVTVLFSMAYISFAINVLARYVYLLNAWMMPHTPKWALLGVMCFTVFIIAKKNLQIIARFSIIASVVFTGFVISALFSMKDANFSFLLPVGANGVMPIIKGVQATTYSYFGYEFFLLFSPFIQPANKGIVRAATIANIFVTGFYFILVVVTIMYFTKKELLMIPEPVLFLIKSISFKIIERPDLFFTSMWIVLVATTLMITLYAVILGFRTVMTKAKINYIAIAVIALIFLGTLPINDMFKIKAFTTFNDQYLRIVIWALPIILLLISFIFNKKEVVKDK